MAVLAVLAGAILPAGAEPASPVWDTFNGDLAAQKFSPLTQITPENVKDLRVAWRMHTGDVSWGAHGIPPTTWSATPLFVNDSVYVGTPLARIFALAPDSGKVKWTYDTKPDLSAAASVGLKGRGVAYWQAAEPVAGAPCQKRIYIGTIAGKLHAVDADTGKPCADFGKAGILDVSAFPRANGTGPLSLLQPPTVFEDYLFLGWAVPDWVDSVDSPGTVFALDARTGAVRWTFHALPDGIVARTGTANVWASMSIDRERRILYLPVASPSPNFYGGALPVDLPLVTSVTALALDSGKVLWSRQLVHHDLWDYDTNAAPTLVDIRKDGRVIPALVQTSKQGFLYVLDRTTGEPIFPIEERAAPASTAAGEHAAPTQPYVARPPAVVPDRWPGLFALADAASFGECSRRAAGLRYDGRFTPPSLQGSLIYPGSVGGTQWGGGALDPSRQVFVVNSSSVVEINQLVPRQVADSGSSSEQERILPYPMKGSPYGVRFGPFMNRFDMPCWNPPYGTIAAYDLASGEQLWNRPFGQVQKWGFYMPESWGSVSIGGPAVTASGLIFIGASMDSRVRALDLATGKELWRALVSAPAVALPAIYDYQGRQYVVFVAGGNSLLGKRVSDEVVAFSLPE